MTRWHPLVRKAGGYVVTGGAAALVDLGGFALGLRAGLQIVPAASASFLAATVVNYLLSSTFVFKTRRSLHAYLLFGAVACVGAVINVGVTALVAAHTPLPAIAAKVGGIGIAFFFNFAANVLFVFRPPAGVTGARDQAKERA